MRISLPIITFALASATFTGCKQEVSHKLFQRETEIHDMDRFAAAQSAAGARQDGMLYSHHFSGTELNSLGRSKLHLMTLDKPATEPLAVYLNTTNDPLAHERETTIGKFLQDHGLTASDMQIKMGANPRAAYPASSGLIRYSKTESGAAEGTVDSTGTNTGSNSAAGAKPSSPSK
ncbi:MAG TPA: hypothetical protein VGP99_08885 [Tepidisphaeraceae bacterium]|nr:hypothetical protein [Tepidisphaeraceae bacterium]